MAQMSWLRSFALLLVLLPLVVRAQTAGPFQANQPLSSSLLNNMFGKKTDVTNGSLTNPTITGGSINGAVVSGSSAVATGATTGRSLADRFGDVVYAKDFGAIFDDASHQLSDSYGSLGAAQAV